MSIYYRNFEDREFQIEDCTSIADNKFKNDKVFIDLDGVSIDTAYCLPNLMKEDIKKGTL